MVTKKKTAKRTSKNQAQPMRSFRVEKEQIPFTSLKITRQTLYWIALLIIIIAMQLWIIKLQLDVSHLTDLLLLSQ